LGNCLWVVVVIVPNVACPLFVAFVISSILWQCHKRQSTTTKQQEQEQEQQNRPHFVGICKVIPFLPCCWFYSQTSRHQKDQRTFLPFVFRASKNRCGCTGNNFTTFTYNLKIQHCLYLHRKSGHLNYIPNQIEIYKQLS